MAWNVSGLSTNVTLGAYEILKEADILVLVETWEHKANSLPCIGGFACISSVFNEKRFKIGQGFGGIGNGNGNVL